MTRAGFAALTEKQQRAAGQQPCNDTYGFDLDAVLEQQHLELLQRGESIYAVPEQLLTHFADFPCIAIGMLIGEWHAGSLRAVARTHRPLQQRSSRSNVSRYHRNK